MSEPKPPEIYLRFDDGPGPVGPRFIESETPDGRSVGIGKWMEHPDGSGNWVLAIPNPYAIRDKNAELEAEVERMREDSKRADACRMRAEADLFDEQKRNRATDRNIAVREAATAKAEVERLREENDALRTHGELGPIVVDEAARDKLAAKVAELTKDKERMEDHLISVEWHGDDEDQLAICPFCGNGPSQGHFGDCPFVAIYAARESAARENSDD